MSAIDQYIERITDKGLQEQIRREVDRLLKKKSFGLVFEHHMPDNLLTPEVPIRRGTNVVIRNKSISDVYEVQELTDTEATCIQLSSMNEVVLPLNDLVAVAQRGDVIYPYLKPMDSVKNAPDSELWHTLIEADNYHALQLLVYLYSGQVDCIYIDPPYNTGARDWKYNNDYVDGSDSYRHSKWLSMMEKRLLLAKKLLNPHDSVLIVTIDEKEYLHLGCLLESLFPEATIQMVSSVISHHGAIRTNEFSRVNEFIFFVMFGDYQIIPFEDAGYVIQGDKIHWQSFRRSSPANIRPSRPSQFYPIYVDISSGRIVEVGDPITPDIDRFTVPNKEGCETVFPVRDDGTEMMWSWLPEVCRKNLELGYIKAGKYSPNKPQQYSIQYLMSGTINEIKNGNIQINGYAEDGSVIATNMVTKKILPKSQWDYKSHDARDCGTKILKNTLGELRFEFPKSLYAVRDCLKLFVANKPNALILDFFAGSGTTLHAVNLLNAEDGGSRRCIMVTNNEIGEAKENELQAQGIKPGDSEWEKWGIAQYVNWPRTICSIKGVDISGKSVEGDYITAKKETLLNDRRFIQINFFPEKASLKQKKSLVSLINKQKTIKLPIISEDVDFLISDEGSSYNASIIFNLSAIDEWESSLEGHDEITDIFVVTQNDAQYRKIKKEVSELLGMIEETVPVSMPMKDGFKANAAFFKLGFLDKKSVARGRQLQELLPVLWMKAGAKGECPTSIDGDYAIWPNNHIAILKKESCFLQFRNELENHSEIEVVYIITDSQNAYLAIIDELRGYKTYQLYRDYLENFRINYAIK